MAGRPKRRAARAAAAERWGGAHVLGPKPSCPPGHTLYELQGRVVCVSAEVQHWLSTGNGRGSELTRNGTPAMARADLERAIREHLGVERQLAGLNKRFGAESKFETRAKLVDDDYGQGLWLWLNTSRGRGIYPNGTISVVVDHG